MPTKPSKAGRRSQRTDRERRFTPKISHPKVLGSRNRNPNRGGSRANTTSSCCLTDAGELFNLRADARLHPERGNEYGLRADGGMLVRAVRHAAPSSNAFRHY